MNRKIKFEARKTYATEETVDKAVAKAGYTNLRYFIMKADDGRVFPVFVGQEAVQQGVHFNFHVVG